MKKFSALAIAASLFFSLGLSAQDNMGLHLGAGLSAGFDGVGADVVFQPYIPYVQLRAGFSTLPYTYSSKSFEIKEKELINNYRINGEVAVKVSPNFDAAHLFADIYPGASTKFRFTLGAYFNINPNYGLIHISTAQPLPLEHKSGDTWSPASNDFGQTGLQVNDENGNEKYIITTDKEGYMHASLGMGGLRNDFNLPLFRPYLGIGFGRGLVPDKRVTFLFDLGVIYCGKYSIEVNGYSPSHHETFEEAHLYELTSEDVTSIINSVSDSDSKAEIQEISDKVFYWMNKIPVAPVFKFSVLVRIF